MKNSTIKSVWRRIVTILIIATLIKATITITTTVDVTISTGDIKIESN